MLCVFEVVGLVKGISDVFGFNVENAALDSEVKCPELWR